MTFTSFTFLFFFPLVIFFYNITPAKWKNFFLFITSYSFYISLQPIYAALLLGVTTTTYFFAKIINQTDNDEKRSRYLLSSIIVVFIPLFFYKYFSFFNELIISIFATCGIGIKIPELSYALPIGISFYTFMAIGYLVDVYNEEVEFEKSFLNTSLFLCFFPIVLSGPIERAKNMFPQFHNLKNSTSDDIISGIRMMIWGYFMKLCVADRLAIYVDAIFNNIDMHSGSSILIASLLFPIQMYADLGGYSLIAIGVANSLGIRIIPNFRRPFFATSMSELWRRWHMSLIQWITDYIYTPISFSLRKRGNIGIVISLMAAFIISGLWHGATIPFIIWGCIQGVYLSIEALSNNWRIKKESHFHLTKQWWYTLLCSISVFILFAFSEIYGRCATLSDANLAIVKIFSDTFTTPFIDLVSLSYGMISLLILFIKDFIDEYHPHIKLLNNRNIYISAIVSSFTIAYIILFGIINNSQFIYFQF